MLTEALWIGLAYALGLLARMVALPPLVGYLIAGFCLSYLAQYAQLPVGEGHALKHISHIGVLLLLFTVGLKLKIHNLLKSEVIGPGLLHFAIVTASYTSALHFLLGHDPRTSLLLSIALSFSSTVLSAKVLESKKELASFHGKTAIAILILQDLIALFAMALTTDKTPTPYALLVLLLPFLRPILFKLIDMAGRDDLFVLLGVLLAVVAGGFGFESVGLSGELGALFMGMLTATHPRSKDLTKSLWAIKEFFLIGFFLNIGIGSTPTLDDLAFALLVNTTLLLKGFLFFALLVAFKLRGRSSFLSSLSLTAFSEFGLIVASVALPEWLVPLALTVTLSFIISAPLNALAHPIYERFHPYITRFERNTRHPDEQTIYLEDAEVLIMGLGRTGTAAYHKLIEIGKNHIAGMDSNLDKVEAFKEHDKMNVYFGDAEDPLFWEKLDLGCVKSVLLCISEVEPKIEATKKLRARNFKGIIATHCMDPEEQKILKEAGIDRTYLTLSEAGVSLAKCL